MTDDNHGRLLAFQALLDESAQARERVVEMTAFRRLCARGELYARFNSSLRLDPAL